MAQKSFFHGREEYLEVIAKRINGLKNGYRQNLAILGDELSGKTSLVYKFLENFSDNHILPLYIEVRPESLNNFARRFIGVLLYNFLINSAEPMEENLESLIRKSDKYIPRTCAKIRNILSSLSRRKKNNIFFDLLSLSDLIYQESRKSCVLILDEFQNLEKMEVNNLYGEWSKILLLQKNTLYIIISSLKFKAEAILSKNLRLLFGNFQVIAIEPFDIKASEGYLQKKLCGFPLEPGLRNFIVNFSGGVPFYLEVICEGLLKSGPDNLPGVLEKLIFDSAGMLNQRFSNYLKRFMDIAGSQEYISTIYHIASGHNKTRDIAHLLRKAKKDITPVINHLLEVNTISRSGDFLKINDRVFAFWIRAVYQKKIDSLTFDAKNQKAGFLQDIETMIKEFLKEAGKPLIERLGELLRMFEDDTIQVEKKKLRLNHFREIRPLEFNYRNIKQGLLGRSSESLWIVAFKPGQISEDDIIDFSKECRKYRHKTQRKILISQDIDTNARLRAMDEKIFTWNLDGINEILDLFSKPRIFV